MGNNVSKPKDQAQTSKEEIEFAKDAIGSDNEESCKEEQKGVANGSSKPGTAMSNGYGQESSVSDDKPLPPAANGLGQLSHRTGAKKRVGFKKSALIDPINGKKLPSSVGIESAHTYSTTKGGSNQLCVRNTSQSNGKGSSDEQAFFIEQISRVWRELAEATWHVQMINSEINESSGQIRQAYKQLNEISVQVMGKNPEESLEGLQMNDVFQQVADTSLIQEAAAQQLMAASHTLSSTIRKLSKEIEFLVQCQGFEIAQSD